MTLQAYPTSPIPQWTYTKEAKFNTKISVFENGVEQRKSKWGQPRITFTLAYNVITATELATLWDFYVARKGSLEAFTFVEPLTSTSYTVRFLDDNMSADEFAYQIAKTGLKLVTVFSES